MKAQHVRFAIIAVRLRRLANAIDIETRLRRSGLACSGYEGRRANWRLIGAARRARGNEQSGRQRDQDSSHVNPH